jgi:hypothetical protein
VGSSKPEAATATLDGFNPSKWINLLNRDRRKLYWATGRDD